MRLFVALSLPDEVADTLTDLQTGLIGAAWRPYDNLHLTLAFIGEADRRVAADLDGALSDIALSPFQLQLSGCGQFGDRKPRAVWAGVRPSQALMALQSKVATALRRAGAEIETRKFTPHVTLAYLRGAAREEVAAYVAAQGLYASPPFAVEAFHLYESQLGRGGSEYQILETYPLAFK